MPTNQTLILFPMLALVGLTLFVVALMGIRRIAAVRARLLRPRDFALGEPAVVPEAVALPNRNFMNLMEVPVLFYVVCLAFYATQQVTALAVALAWAFVGLRFLHSAVHLTTNRVPVRLGFFAGANVVLLVMWIDLLMRLTR